MKYYLKGINKNKKIRQERKKPLPIGLMNESKRPEPRRRNVQENPYNSETI